MTATSWNSLSQNEDISGGSSRKSTDFRYFQDETILISREYVMPVPAQDKKKTVNRTSHKQRTKSYRRYSPEYDIVVTEMPNSQQTSQTLLELLQQKVQNLSDNLIGNSKPVKVTTGHDDQIQLNDDTFSAASTCSRTGSSQLDFEHLDPLEQTKRVYNRECRLHDVTPMSLFNRQLGQPTIDLHFNFVGEIGARTIALPLMVVPGLRSLNLSNCDIGDFGLECIVTGLTRTSIQELDVSYNKLSSLISKELATFIKICKTLQILNISGNHIGNAGAKLIAPAIVDSEKLKIFAAKDCNFEEAAGICLGNAIGECDTLTELDLSWNHLRLRGALAIGKGLKINNQLQKLDISWNGFSTVGSEAIGEALERNTVLEELNLSHNRLNDTAVQKLLQGLQKNQGLVLLKLSGNTITTKGSLALMAAIESNTNMTLRQLEIQGIPLHQEFNDRLLHIRSSYPDFQVYDDMDFKGFKVKNQAVEQLFEYLCKTNLTLKDIFGMSNKHRVILMLNEQFKSQLKNANTPLSEQQIDEIARLLSGQDKLSVNLSYLYKRWKVFLEDWHTENNEKE